jgi:two-component system, LuxR family, sensor kinase FixL
MENSPEPGSIGGPLVLVVDDDEDTRLNLCDILELDGYRVEVAGTAQELLARERWEEVSLVLLDRKLPDGTAQDVVPLLRQKVPQVAIIIVTGYADVEGAIAALQSGAADYILKPVNADALRVSVRRVLQRQQDEQEIARLHRLVVDNERRCRAMFENTLDGLLVLNDDGRIVDANPAACHKLCTDSHTLRGKHLADLVVRRNGQTPVATWSDFFAPGKNRGECLLVRDNGTPADFEYRAAASFSPGLHLISLRDVTARKQAEERARQSERLAAIGETMAGLVHESRNALQRSKACLEMLTLELEQQPAALQLVARAQRAQDDLHRLYEEVRQWAAPLNLRREACDLRELWNEVWIQVRQARPALAAQLEEQIACETSCQIDRFAMAQVFRNIFENALEVSPAGASVTVRCALVSNSHGDEIVIAISDEGPGLTAEQQNRIFQPFFTTKAKGTGLGMAIASRIVQSHGGSITAHSPRGAQIEIQLPRGVP